MVVVGLAVFALFCCINSLMDGAAEGVGCGSGLAVYDDRDADGGGVESGMRDSVARGRIAHMVGFSLTPGGGFTYCCCLGGGERGGGGGSCGEYGVDPGCGGVHSGGRNGMLALHPGGLLVSCIVSMGTNGGTLAASLISIPDGELVVAG